MESIRNLSFAKFGDTHQSTSSCGFYGATGFEGLQIYGEGLSVESCQWKMMWRVCLRRPSSPNGDQSAPHGLASRLLQEGVQIP